MSLRAQSGTALWASLYPGLGATGAAILAATSTGQHGAGPLANDGLLSAAEYYWRLATGPTGGTLVRGEIGDAIWSGLSDGTSTFTYRLWQNGVEQAGPTISSLTVGVSSPPPPPPPPPPSPTGMQPIHIGINLNTGELVLMVHG